jgi:hypothetical protein
MVDWLKQRTKKAPKRADVIVVVSPEGAGKTSFAANFKDATFAMSATETGLLTLMSKGLCPDCEYFPEFTSWTDLEEATNEMVASADRPRTFVVDTVNGCESLLVDHICRTKYGGEMTKKGFLNYNEGWDAIIPSWRVWLSRLEALRNKGTTIVLLSHSRTVNFKNPEGPDFHRYVSELHEQTWAATKKFADLICFLNFHTEIGAVDDTTGKGKALGGTRRVYHFERCGAFDAKHRHGLPSKMIGVGNPAADFAEFGRLVKEGADPKKRAAKVAKPEPAGEPAPAELPEVVDDGEG